MRSRIVRYVFLAVTGLIFSLPVGATDVNTAMLVNTCVGCHGPNGSSVGPATPSIAGMSKYAFIKAMQEGKSNQRPTTIMGRIARGYTDEQIEIMADFFSQQEFVRYPQQFDAKKVKHGAHLHNEYCESCHRYEGRKDEHDSGILAGQWMPYLKISLSEFMTTDRPSPTKMKKRMEYMVHFHGEESLEDLVHFYGSQQ